MRIILKQIVRFSLVLASTAVLWAMGPMGLLQPELAFAKSSGQIDRLGHGLALETYYDVASSAQVSAGGYGGPGHSGGDGDALVRLVNVGNSAVQTNGVPGALCANIYVFDDDQELQACCSCEITRDGVLTLSTINDLISNPAFNRAKTSVGAIKVVTSSSSGPDGTGCFNFSPVTATEINASDLAEGLKGWINHSETIASNLPPSFSFVTSTSVDEFANAPLDSGELTELTTNCNAIVSQGSGAGVCAPLCFGIF